MAEGYWNTTTKKLTATIGMGILSYNVLQPFLTFLPKLHTGITTPFIGQLSLVTVAAGATAYGIWFLWGEV